MDPEMVPEIVPDIVIAPDDEAVAPQPGAAAAAEAACGVLEARLGEAGFRHIAGADEVGRGALAGPLVAAAVILPADVRIEGLRDSKLCTKQQRNRLAEEIVDVALGVSIVRVQPWRIDRIGLQKSNLNALRRALNGLQADPDYILVDCFKMRRLQRPSLAVKKGDVVSKSVAAASIVAKVHRDAAMRRYHRRYPDYGFASNVGYGTRFHWNALKQHGPCEIHRRSFYGVTGFIEDGVFCPHPARDLEDTVDLEEGERMSVEDLEKYEAEMELQLYKEYRDVLPMFKFVVETERRFYLANEVKVDTRHQAAKIWFEVELNDAWVWDMHRPARFVSHVKVVTFRDLNVEELSQLADRDLIPEPPGIES